MVKFIFSKDMLYHVSGDDYRGLHFPIGLSISSWFTFLKCDKTKPPPTSNPIFFLFLVAIRTTPGVALMITWSPKSWPNHKAAFLSRLLSIGIVSLFTSRKLPPCIYLKQSLRVLFSPPTEFLRFPWTCFWNLILFRLLVFNIVIVFLKLLLLV